MIMQSQNSTGWKISGPNLHRNGSPWEIIQHPVPLHLENLQQWRLYHISGEAVPVNGFTHRKKIISRGKVKPPLVQLYMLLLGFSMRRCIFMRRFHPLCSHTLNTGILWWDPLWAIFSQIKRPDCSHLSSQGRFCSLLFISMVLLWTLSHQSMSFMSSGDQNWTHYYRCGLTSSM